MFFPWLSSYLWIQPKCDLFKEVFYDHLLPKVTHFLHPYNHSIFFVFYFLSCISHALQLFFISLFHYNTLFLASNSLTQLYHHPSSQSCCQMTKKSERYNKEGTRKKEKEQGATGASLDWWLCHGLPVPVDLSAHKPRKARLQWRKIVGRRNHCFTPRLRNSQAEIHKVLELEAIEK